MKRKRSFLAAVVCRQNGYSVLKSIVPGKIKTRVKLFLRNVLQSLRYYLMNAHCGEIDHIERVLFVCKGNICRSAFAEHIFKNLPGRVWSVESCGLDVNQGTSPPEDAVRAALSFGIDLSYHVPRHINNAHIRKTDLIIGMEYEHYRRLIGMAPEYKENIRLLRQYLPFPRNLFVNVDDPYGHGSQEFVRCFTGITQAARALFRSRELREKNIHD